MLIAAYVPTPADLSTVGGPEDGYVEDAVTQEADIASGEVVFEWSALDHVPVTDTMSDFESEQADQESDEPDLGTQDEPFDYFHINSMTEGNDGSILVSARHTHAVYSLERTTGDVDWTLGGSASDFELEEDGSLREVSVLLGATSGRPRHSLMLDSAMRPLFSFLRTKVLSSAVFAVADDWGEVTGGQASARITPLQFRVEAAGQDLASMVSRLLARPRQQTREAKPLEVIPFDQLLKGN